MLLGGSLDEENEKKKSREGGTHPRVLCTGQG